jgi:hypothetical protein
MTCFLPILLLTLLSNIVFGRVSCTKEVKQESSLIWKTKTVSIKSGDHFNFSSDDFKNLHQYNYLSLDIELNSDENDHQIFISLQDEKSTNYWNQLNHIATITKGKQRIFVPLGQLIGERGSQKIGRKLNLKKIKKVFASFNPDHPDKKGKVFLSKLQFMKMGRPAFPKGIRVLNFGEAEKIECIEQISEKSPLFKNIDIWRKQDSVYLDPFLRSVLFINKGELNIPVKNGTYEITLFWNDLGYWHPSFFKKRSVFLNGRPWRIEDRSDLRDYEKDLFVFEDREPNVTDHPWDWLFKDVMRPLTKKVVVKNGRLVLSFRGDTSAVAINGLILAKVDTKKEQGVKDRFIKDFKNYLRSLYDIKIRPTYREKTPFVSTKPVLEVNERLSRLSPFKVLKDRIKSQELFLSSNTGQFLELLLNTPTQGELEISFISKSNKENPFKVEIFKGRDQWVSLDRNHESYTIETQYFDRGKSAVRAKKNQHFVLSFKGVDKDPLTQVWQGEMVVSVNKDVSWKVPLKVSTLGKKLPRPELQVGFIGLNSLRYHYFVNPEKTKKLKLLDEAYLKLLSEGGFTSFTAIPTYQDNSQNLSPIILKNVENFLGKANELGMKPPYYSYGGPFLHEFFEGGSAENILKNKDILKHFLSKKSTPEIVFQFTDEAAGYSNTVERDRKRHSFLREHFPRLKLGGFIQWQDDLPNKISSFNKIIDRPSLSHLGYSGLNWFKENHREWGFYNQAQGGRENPYEVFGRKLFKWSRNPNFSYYHEWNTSAVQNLPYFDLDGREADVAVALPDSKGELHPSIKFFQATEGLTDFRWLNFQSQRKALKGQGILKSIGPSSLRGKVFQSVK